MSIRTSRNSKGLILSDRSPVRTLLTSEFLSAIAWLERRKDKKTGNRIGRIDQIDDSKIIKWGKDSFSFYCRTVSGYSVSINDIRGDEAVCLLRLPDGKIFTADIFVFCLGAGKYILTDWMTVWRIMDQLTHDHGTVIYLDAWRMDRMRFVELLQKAISDKI